MTSRSTSSPSRHGVPRTERGREEHDVARAARAGAAVTRQNTVTVSVDDTRGGHRFDLAVARDRALEAFYHPFAYAAANSDGAL